MAMVSPAKNTECVGGYDCEFVDVPHDDDYCVICLLPARDPQQTKCECAKLYCKTCYDKQKSTSGKCPTCRQPLDAFPDRKSARKVKDLRVKCTSTGCPWVNELRLLADHLEVCGYVLAPCANGCGDHIIRDNRPLHNKVCALRKHTCKLCKSKGTYKEMTGGHLDECPDFEVPCPNNGCRVIIKRKQMDSHHLKCPYLIISCPYKEVGCTYTSERRANTMEDHKANSYDHHLDLAMVQLITQEKRIHMTVIRMPHFNWLKVSNKTWYSPGFYTHPCGYKMCLCVDANGDGGSKGTHVSVFMCMMTGENDDTLTWPIRYKCTITLLNQLKDEGHHLDTINYTTDEADDVNSRVLSRKRGSGWGAPQFIPHDELDLQDDEECQYLKDDSLYFRVQVEILPACKPWLMVTVPSEDA